MRNDNDTNSNKLEDNTGIILFDKINSTQINYNKMILGNSGQGMSSSLKKISIGFENEFKELISGMSGCFINMNDDNKNPPKIDQLL